jgi:hypothetical protein
MQFSCSQKLYGLWLERTVWQLLSVNPNGCPVPVGLMNRGRKMDAVAGRKMVRKMESRTATRQHGGSRRRRGDAPPPLVGVGRALRRTGGASLQSERVRSLHSIDSEATHSLSPPALSRLLAAERPHPIPSSAARPRGIGIYLVSCYCIRQAPGAIDRSIRRQPTTQAGRASPSVRSLFHLARQQGSFQIDDSSQLGSERRRGRFVDQSRPTETQP